MRADHPHLPKVENQGFVTLSWWGLVVQQILTLQTVQDPTQEQVDMT